jgi:hypothetical protein
MVAQTKILAIKWLVLDLISSRGQLNWIWIYTMDFSVSTQLCFFLSVKLCLICSLWSVLLKCQRRLLQVSLK